MAEGVLGLGSSGAASLNQELIDKLKAAEKKARVDPIDANIEKIGKEKEVFENIETKVKELLEAIKPFDLFVSGGSTAFQEKAATTSGTSVVFEAADVSKLSNGVMAVKIDSLAQKDVYQSNTVAKADKDTLGDIGILSIEVNGETHDFNTASYATYDELTDAINKKAGINASFDEVSPDNFRLVIKSEKSGTENALKITGTASQALGYTTDGSTVNSANQTLEAKNMKAFVDGVEYNVATNVLNVNGLKMTATSTGESSINVTQDTASIETKMQNFVTKYNELNSLISQETVNANTPLSDRGQITNVLTQIKDKLFGNYGEAGDKNVFTLGFEIDKTGFLKLDSAKFNETITKDISILEDLFIGTAAKEGLGTQLKATIDEMSFSGGALTTYESSMTKRESTLKEDKTKAEEALDTKYSQLANQFGQYSAIITRFESQFAGLKLMIQQSTSG